HRALASHARSGFSEAAAAVADLLRKEVLRLPAQADECALRPWGVECVSHRAQLPLEPHPSNQTRDQPRRLGLESLWPSAVPDLLQDLHREGVGHSLRQ